MTISRFFLYNNAMESLVAAEVSRQLQKMPPELAQSINPNEAIAYALNRLPPLYSTTEAGWYWQQQRAKEIFADLIAKAAGWGLTAVQRKPSPFPTALSEANEYTSVMMTPKKIPVRLEKLSGLRSHNSDDYLFD